MGLTRNLIGYGCVGGAYQSIKKTLTSDSVLGSGFYSALAGLLATGAYRFLDDTRIVQRLERILSEENEETARQARELLRKRFPQLADNSEKSTNYPSDIVNDYKRRLMKERGYM